METFTFYDKDTGDLIQTGSANDYSLNASTTRAISGFHASAPVSVFQASVYDDGKHLNSNIFDGKTFDYSSGKGTITFETISSCPKKPRVISPTHFYVSHDSFLCLKSDIDDCLKQRPELVFSSFPREYMWKCKYLEGSQSREMHVSCFWDSAKKSHLVEVKRVHGDGIFPQYTDLTTVLRQGLGCASAASISTATKRPCPPPMLARSNNLGLGEVSPCPVQFRTNIKAIVDMALNDYNEPRLEASKMLCDIIQRHPLVVLESELVQPDILETLNTFLVDTHEPVVEFGVVATHLLLQRSPVYRSIINAYKEGAILISLIAHIRNCDKDDVTGEDVDFYQYAQMRRLSGQALHLLTAEVCSEGVVCAMQLQRRAVMSRILQRAGFFCREDWMEYISRLEDDLLRESVQSVALWY